LLAHCTAVITLMMSGKGKQKDAGGAKGGSKAAAAPAGATAAAGASASALPAALHKAASELAGHVIGACTPSVTGFDNAVEDHLSRIDEISALVDSVRAAPVPVVSGRWCTSRRGGGTQPGAKEATAPAQAGYVAERRLTE
jgi:hypothetical protein